MSKMALSQGLVRAILLRHFSPLCLLLVTLIAAAAQPTPAPPHSAEYARKAASLCDFCEFTDWPSNAFATATSPLVIGILGKDPFGGDLDDVARDKKVNHRPVVIQRYRRIDETKDCQVLFVSASETKRLGRILTALKGRSILTVGDMPDFASRGGMVRLLTDGDQLEFHINLDVLKAAGLSVSSKLLRVAEIVSTTKK